MTYTFNLSREIKGYVCYTLDGLPGAIYVPRGMVLATAPATITISADGFAEPKAVQQPDPAELQALATKAAERATRAAEQAAKLAARVEQLKATATTPAPPAVQPVSRARKSKAVQAA